MSSALAAFGFFSTQSARMPSDFSGCFAQISAVLTAVKPMPWLTSCAFHGSPTQKASMVPTFMLATICGGGTTIVSTSLVGIDAAGGEPVADPQIVRAAGEGHGHLGWACRPPSSANASFSAPAVGADVQILVSLRDRDRLASRLSRARMYIGVGWLFCVTVPVRDQVGHRRQDVRAVDAVARRSRARDCRASCPTRPA